MDLPKIAIIILNLNGKEIIGDCVDSLHRTDYSNFEIIVVDNNSSDGSQEFIRNNYPDIYLVENKKNEGVAEGQNIGILKALERNADYIFVINNDIIVDENTIKTLLQVFNDESVGIAVPVMYWPDDPKKIQSAGGMIKWKTGGAYHLNANEKNVELPKVREIDYLGSIFTTKKLLKEIGLFDPIYFAYWEDTDLCFRFKKAGYKVVSVSDAKIWHKHSYTTKKINGFIDFYFNRNSFIFMKKNSNKIQYTSFLLYFFLYKYWFRVFSLIFYYKKPRMINYLNKGIKEGLNYRE